MKLRIATPADGAALNRIKREASLVADEYRQALLAHPDLLRVPEDQLRAGAVLLAEHGRDIVGFAAVGRREDGIELEGLFVAPSHWRRGVGRRLVQGAATEFGGDAPVAVHVVASPDAVAFYQACGFDVVSDTTTRFGPAIVMRCAGTR